MDDSARKFKLHSLNVDFASLSEEQRRAFVEYLCHSSTEARWWQEEQLRYSVIKCAIAYDGHIYGWLTQQHRLEQHLYSDSKDESSNTLDSYEDRLFVLHLSRNQITLEWRQFRRAKPLSLSLMTRRLGQILTEAGRSVGLSQEISLSPIQVKTTKEQFISLFYGNRVTHVIVENFGSQSVPSDIILVNPNPHLEGALRELVEHDVRVNSIKRFEAETEKRPGGGDLRASALARAAIHSGDPSFLQYCSNDHLLVRRRDERGEIEVSVPTWETDTPKDRIGIVSQVLHDIMGLDIPRDERQSQDSQLSLFE